MVIFTTCGHPVRTNSPGCSVSRLSIVRSANVSAVSRPLLLVVLLMFPLELLALLFVLFNAFEPHVSMFICVVDDTSVARCMFSSISLLISVQVRISEFNFLLSPFTSILRICSFEMRKMPNSATSFLIQITHQCSIWLKCRLKIH